MVFLFNFSSQFIFFCNWNKQLLIIQTNFRSSHQRCSVRKGVLRNFAKFTGKHLRQSLFFNKVAVLRPATLLKKRLWHRCFPVNFAKFLRTPFLQNTSGRMLLKFPVLKTRTRVAPVYLNSIHMEFYQPMSITFFFFFDNDNVIPHLL